GSSPADARPATARVVGRARVVVVARGAVLLGRVAAHAGRGIARPGDVALVGGRAHDGAAARADARLAGVGLRAGVVGVARGGVPGGGALAGRGIARAAHVALIGRRAVVRDGGAGTARAAVLRRAEVAVVARAAVGLRRRDAVCRPAVGRAGAGVARVCERA